MTVQLNTRTNVQFKFRENKETNVKRSPVELEIPEVTVASIAEYLQSADPKVVSLVIETVQGLLNSYVRSNFVDGDEAFDQAKLDALIAEGKVGLEAIANLPRAERSTLTNAELEEFGKVYYVLAQELLGKSVAQATAAAAVFNSRVKKIAGNPAALTKVQGDLEVFIEKADEAVIEEHSKALQYLVAKIADYLAEDITEDSL